MDEVVTVLKNSPIISFTLERKDLTMTLEEATVVENKLIETYNSLFEGQKLLLFLLPTFKMIINQGLKLNQIFVLPLLLNVLENKEEDMAVIMAVTQSQYYFLIIQIVSLDSLFIFHLLKCQTFPLVFFN